MTVNYLSLAEEEKRLKSLENYKLLGTSPEEELQELTEIASTICGTPISLITLIDSHSQWFKARYGVEITHTSREVSFCQHALHQPDEVMVVEDVQKDSRFAQNPFVINDPHVRFYAGAPLVAPEGHVLGTLCILDSKPRKIAAEQTRTLQLLAKRAMNYLNTRKLLLEQEKSIEANARKLMQLTDQAPGALYQLKMSPKGDISFEFMSKGITDLHPELSPEALRKDATLAYSIIHPDDLPMVRKTLVESAKKQCIWNVSYRILKAHGGVCWNESLANPELLPDGSTLWHGALMDITGKKEYEQSLEEFLFNISHQLRRPISNLLGLTHLAELSDTDLLKECFEQVKVSSLEMDKLVKSLHRVYTNRQMKSSDKTARPNSITKEYAKT